MSATLTPADASAKNDSVRGGRVTKIKGQIVRVAPAAQLLDVQAVAKMLGCSTRHVYRLSDAGKMPQPVRLGSLVRWRTEEVQEWVKNGCKPVRSVRGA